MYSESDHSDKEKARRDPDSECTPLIDPWYDVHPSFPNFQDLYNLRHLVRQWYATIHTFFFSCGELTVTLEDVANQLLLPILDDVDPATI